jgi:diguanylate cyclase (GGDEF)-like protein/PAS domain S-box-containing protein
VTFVQRLAPSRRTLWAWYIVALTGLTAAYLFVPPLKGYAVVVNVIGVSSLIAIAAGMRLHRPRAMAAWSLILLGQMLYVAGDFYTYTYPDLLGGTVGFPSAGDAIYLSVYPALFTGLMLLVRRRDPHGRDRSAVVDSLILTVGFALLSWVFLVAPNLHLSGLTVLAKLVSVAYPLGDVLLLGALIRFAVQAGAKGPAFYFLVAGTVGLLATDCAYNYALLAGTYNHQLIYDAGWLAYLVLWGAAALHPSMRGLEEPAADTRVRLTPTRLALLATACLIAPGIHFVEELGNTDLLVVIGASAILFLLVVLRMAGLVRQEERATARELALRHAGLALVEAVGRASVNDEVAASTAQIVGASSKVRLVLWTEEGAQVAASNGAGSWNISPDAAEWIRAQAQPGALVAVVHPAEQVLVALGLGEARNTLVVRLSVRDEHQGAIVVQSPTHVPADIFDSLEAFASQVSLALEAASLAENLHRQKSEARFRSLVAHSSDLITVLDRSGVVTYQSPSVERVLGYTVEEIENQRFDRLLAESDRSRLEPMVSAGTGAGAESHTFDCSLQHRDGRWLQFEVQHTQLLEDEHIQGIVLNSRDVSERKAFEEQLAHQAFHDPVTDLANRALFADRVGHALRSTVRKGSLIAVMFIDLDDFKTVNDSLGHQAGDAVLLEVARRLERAIRPADTVARFGGDEFAILLDGVSGSDEAALIAERLLAELEAAAEIDGKQVYPRASVGICMSDEDLLSQDAEELLRNADVAMYMAKRDSKGRYRLFEPAMHERVVERLELRAELQQALELQQLEVYYQPVVHLSSGGDYGVEALLRWHHPERGLIQPAHFIPLAEETGLIIPIGKWVIEQACSKAVELQRRFPLPEPLRMSVNLSVKQLQADSIVEDIRGILESTGLSPATLVLEVTETVMLADADVAAERLHRLKDLGVRIAMDDFGTGYSSLSYLSRLPVDIIKMDRSFLGGGIDDNGLAAAIMAIGERLGLEVVAEGIERRDQIDSLQSLGFGLGQGFLFGRPMPQGPLNEYLGGHGESISAKFDSDAA